MIENNRQLAMREEFRRVAFPVLVAEILRIAIDRGGVLHLAEPLPGEAG